MSLARLATGLLKPRFQTSFALRAVHKAFALCSFTLFLTTTCLIMFNYFVLRITYDAFSALSNGMLFQ